MAPEPNSKAKITPEQEPSFKSDEFSIHLSLSGGGLRATLFHIGVIRFLKQSGQLRRVERIVAVSGGSITAAHLATHWADYCDGDDDLFKKRAKELINGACRHGIREKIDFCIFNPNRRFSQLHKAYIDGLNGGQAENAIKDTPARPAFFILGTDFATGRLVSFSKEGITQFETTNDGRLSAVTVPGKKSSRFGLWRAVACSSAFPPMFAPHLISPEEYDENSNSNLTVGDGGVFDNLGIRLVEYYASNEPSSKSILFIISDAGQPFRNAPASKSTFKWLMNRLFRAREIQYFRLAELDVLQFTAAQRRYPCHRVMTINIGDVAKPSAGPTVPDGNASDPAGVVEPALTPEVRDLVCRIRTDLDTFSESEIQALVIRGWELAQYTWEQTKDLPRTLITNIEWHPAGQRVTTDILVEALKKSSIRRVRLFWPLIRLVRNVSFLAGIPTLALWLYWMGAIRVYADRTDKRTYLRVEESILDFPPVRRPVSSLFNGFRRGLPTDSQDFFIDFQVPYRTKTIKIVVISDKGDALILRSWAYRGVDLPTPHILDWVDDEPTKEIIQLGDWAAGTSIRLVFSVKHALVESMKAEFTFVEK